MTATTIACASQATAIDALTSGTSVAASETRGATSETSDAANETSGEASDASGAASETATLTGATTAAAATSCGDLSCDCGCVDHATRCCWGFSSAPGSRHCAISCYLRFYCALGYADSGGCAPCGRHVPGQCCASDWTKETETCAAGGGSWSRDARWDYGCRAHAPTHCEVSDARHPWRPYKVSVAHDSDMRNAAHCTSSPRDAVPSP